LLDTMLTTPISATLENKMNETIEKIIIFY
jgi:hypothetical protein